MKGIQHVEISNRDAKFKFDLYRNITLVRGDSGTGKTTLYDMVSDYTRLGDNSGVNVSSDKKCVALTDSDWKNQLRGFKNSIVFIDEGAEYIRSVDFSTAISKTDNYYVIFSRESLHALPYSVEEIYEIKASGKYHSFKKLYNKTAEHIYFAGKKPENVDYDTVLTEDSNSGYQFFNSFFELKDCVSAKSNSNIFNWLNDNKNKKILVIADGAAFGSEIDRVLKMQSFIDFELCLPESFEWLILKSGLVKAEDLNSVLNNPSDYIESKKYFSWENFFEDYLVKNAKNTPFSYKKSEINPAYLQKTNSEKIMKEIIK